LALTTGAGHSEYDIPTSWSEFRALVRLIPLLDGLESFIGSVMFNYPLPPSHPINSQLKLVNSGGIDSPSGLTTKKISPVFLPATGIVIPELEDAHQRNRKTEHDWCGKSKRLLKCLITDIQDTTQGERTQSVRKIQHVFDTIERLLNDANAIAPETSALHLALRWIKSFISEKNKLVPSTIKTYLSRVFFNGLLCDPESIDLSSWEPEDHELAFEDAISRESLKGASTKRDIYSTYKQAYSYAIEHGFCCSVNLSYIADEWIGGSKRNEIIGLSEFDTFINRLLEDQNRDVLQLAVVCILAFYGGLRASEISRLTLNDLVICDEHLYIDIYKGKTAAARREVPLHLLAPEEICHIVSNLYNSRKSEFSEDSFLTKIPLFGPLKKRERYGSRTLADSAIKLLKQVFGSSICLHSLRHAAVSWIFVRMYACKHPDIIDNLSESTHEVFTITYMRRMTYLMSGKIADQLPEYWGDGLVRFTKLIGHLGPRTMFCTYIHTFHIVQNHAMKRMSGIYGERTLNGKTIAALVPKMKSRASQAKLADKSINSILEYAFG